MKAWDLRLCFVLFKVCLGAEVKDEFPAWRPSCLKFSQQDWNITAKKKGETISLRSRMVKYIIIFLIHFIVLRVVPVLSTIYYLSLKSIPFLYFSRDHLQSTMVITWGRGSFTVLFGDHLRYCTFPSSEVLGKSLKMIAICCVNPG